MILIIGQAPPAVTQKLPYDTTMLYDMLSWVNISKEKAQEMFEFEALVDKFPGHGESGHKIPELEDIANHYNYVLRHKIDKVDKILVLGRAAETYIKSVQKYYPDKKFLYLIHPSRRNYTMIMGQKEKLTKQLNDFI